MSRREVTTFLAVGGAGYVVDLVAFNLLRPTPLDPVLVRAIAVAVAMVVTYLGNRYLTWRHQASDSRRREVALFVLFNLIGFAISAACLVVSQRVLGLHGVWADNVAANVVGVGLGTVFRFVTYRHLVFVGRRTPGPTSAADDAVRSGHRQVPCRTVMP